MASETETTEAKEQANRAGMDPLRLVVIFLLLSAIVLGLFFEQIVGSLFPILGLNDPVLIEGTEGRLSTLLGFAIAIGLAVFVWMHAKTRALATEIASELMKVTWPTWTETRVATTAVVVASLVAAVILFGMDTLAYKLMVDWLPSVWGKL